jgi:AbrB family looped-hinge helix DNA binding protein
MAAREHEVQLGAQGRIVVPASLRKDMGLKPGDRLIARRDGDCLILEPGSVIRHRLQSRFNTVPGQTNLVDELIEERRREARSEADLP